MDCNNHNCSSHLDFGFSWSILIRSRRLKSSEENVDEVNNSSIIPPSQNNGNGNAYEMNQMNE